MKIINDENQQRYYVYNPQVTIKYKIVVSDREGILRLCSLHPDGVLELDIVDAYPQAEEHLKDLIATGRLLTIENAARNGSVTSRVIYPGDLASVGTPVDAQVLKLWDSSTWSATIIIIVTLMEQYYNFHYYCYLWRCNYMRTYTSWPNILHVSPPS